MILSWLMSAVSFLKGLPWQIYAGVGVLLLCGLSYCAGERTGREDERAAWEQEVAEIRAERDEAAKRAAMADEALADQVAKNILERRKELDDATANIPDQELSARQCARVAQLLRREGRGRELSPACAAKLSPSTGEQ